MRVFHYFKKERCMLKDASKCVSCQMIMFSFIMKYKKTSTPNVSESLKPFSLL